jgi:GR25 family glycosyltransferase involved in LPS biosynthesis
MTGIFTYNYSKLLFKVYLSKIILMEGFYINLKHRTDRKEHIEKIIDKYPILRNIERFDAISDNRYGVGCCSSFIEALKLLLDKNQPYYLMLEDDFCILNEDNFQSFITDFEKIKDRPDWDMIVLTPKGNTIKRNYIENFHRIVNHQTATGYIIKDYFIKQLLPILIEGNKHLCEGHDPNLWCSDRCWKPLQNETNFIYYEKIFAGQLPCYSDNEKRFTDYNKAFLDQVKR